MKMGFIGTGNMGTAILKGYLKANPGYESNIYAFDKDKAKLNTLSKESGIHACHDAVDATVRSDMIILAIKPDVFAEALREIVPAMDFENKVIISIAAGISTGYIESLCREISGYKDKKSPFRCKVVRVMPNTPALAGQGMSALCRNGMVTDAEFRTVSEIFSAVGRAEEVDEKLMDCVTGVSGSSPAFVYMFIEALADGAVAMGMNRKQAYTFAAQAVLGSAEMVLKTGMHPGELKDMVCSPGGTTIDAVRSLERNCFRNSVIEAVKTASEKSRSITR